ncbi:MAG: flagellar filament capping protein FliD [candidate division Zixibacteria bacterium]|nr:flagellar filament capping protein FliD [candidate division Zixibacteria bacterium]
MPGFNIDGLVSNLDTTGIVNAIIEAERGNVELLEQRQETATKELTTYNAISAKILALKAAIQPLLKDNAYDAVTLDVSDETAVSVTATGTVAPGTYTLNVDRLATNHQVASQGYDDPATASLGTGTITIGLGTASAQTINIDAGNNTLTGLKNAINAANAGVTASIISDGSSANAYRLVLTANKTGLDNQITVTSNLSGGAAPDFTTASFDTVETVGNHTGTSAMTHGAGSSYTGSTNKAYTFTVAGSGEQTVGSGTITLDWTDGTNSGTIDVDAADTEVALTGDGADGLTVSLGAGTLVAGEQFQVQTFAPLLQEARDAQVSIGSSRNGGSPIVVTSSSNEIENVIEGVTIRLKTDTIVPLTITANTDRDTVKSNITTFLNAYNDVMKDIDKQFEYNPDTEEGGLLIGDQFLLAMQSGLRSHMNGAIDGLPKGMNMLRSIGIQTAANGLMTLVNSNELYDALNEDINSVADLFKNSGTSSNSLISVLSAGDDAVETSDGYEVNITQAATKTVLQGKSIANPSLSPLTLTTANNTLRFVADGIASQDLVLSAKTYNTGAELASELQSKINADPNLGERGVTAEWVDNGDTGYIKLTSGSYGSSSRITMQKDSSTALSALGLDSGTQVLTGRDVEGTINGEAATGSGRLLTGREDNATTAGIRLEVRMEQSDVTPLADATITFTRGFAARLNRAVESISRSETGSMARRTSGLEAEIDDIKTQIADQEERLEVRRQKLFARFIELERTLSDLQSQSSFLDQQLMQLSSNTSQITGKQ